MRGFAELAPLPDGYAPASPRVPLALWEAAFGRQRERPCHLHRWISVMDLGFPGVHSFDKCKRCAKERARS